MDSSRLVRIFAFLVLLAAIGGHANAGPVACANGPIRDEMRINADDAQLFVLARSRNCSRPLVLWLHGGPGGAETPLFRLYDRRLEDAFVVAYWDQRGAGRSYDPGADPAQLTVDRHLRDLDLVIKDLLVRYGKKKVALVGHSWGSALALLYAKLHPDKVSAVVGVNPLVSSMDSQRRQIEFVRSRAIEADELKILANLRAIGDPPLKADQVLRLQSFVQHYGGIFHRKPSFFGAVLAAVARGYVKPWSIPSYIHANEVSLTAMQDEINALDLHKQVQNVEMPIVFMLGRYDHQLDPEVAVDYLKQLSAPKKRIVWFEASAHNIPFEQPDAFVSILEAELGALDD